MWGTRWLWHYPAKNVGMFMIFMGAVSIMFWMSFPNSGLGGWLPDYRLWSGLVEFGTGGALLVYHFRKYGRW